ncbi:MAG: hypothetical protein RMA76_11295 [Deltaproteobacteria bacterium]
MKALTKGRKAIPSWFFSVVVVRLGHRFLLVHEKKHGQQWYPISGPRFARAGGTFHRTTDG